MSVTTTSDKKIEEAKSHIKEAINALLEATDEDTWGHGDLDSKYMESVEEVLMELRKLKRKL